MAGGPKPANTPRRISSSLSKVSTPPTTAPATTTNTTRPSKSSKQSKVIQFKLSKEVLSSFPHETLRKPGQKKASPLSTSTVITPDEPAASATVKSESEPVPVVKGETPAASPAKDIKQEGLPGPKTGAKRELGAGVESDSKEKPKANPRKRPRPDPNRPDGRTAAAKLAKGLAGAGTGSTHKLGPKANQGAINAGLRALDRTGKACRRWEKTGFRVKSFTGRVWEIPSWRAPTAKAFGSEADSNQATSNSQSKENSSSNVGSDKSPAVNGPDLGSSPAPGLAMSA